MVAASLLLAVLGATAAIGGVSATGGVLARGGVAEARRRGEDAARGRDRAHQDQVHAHLGAAGVATDQRSWTWRLQPTDGFVVGTAMLASRCGRLSNALFKVVDDGSYLRASLGIFAVLPYLAAFALGMTAVINVHGHALPPSWPLLAAIMALGIIDALAGLLAGLTYVVGVAVNGGWSSLANVRLSLAIVAAAVVVIVAASYLRPLRRHPARSFGEWFDRVGDVVVASLVAMFVGSRIIEALPAFADRRLSIVDHLLPLVVVVGAAVVLRYGAETLVATRYHAQLVASQAPIDRQPSTTVHLVSAIIGASVFVLFTVAFVGWTWALWVAGILVIVRSVCHRFKGRFPTVPGLHRVTPQGVLKFVVVLVVCDIMAGLLRHSISDKVQLILISTVLLIVPTVLLEMSNAVSKPRPAHAMTWPVRLGGAAVVAFGALVVLGTIPLG